MKSRTVMSLNMLGKDLLDQIIGKPSLSLQDIGRLAQCNKKLRTCVYNHSMLFSRAGGIPVSMKYEEIRAHLDHAYRIRKEIKLLRQPLNYVEQAIMRTDETPTRVSHFLLPSLGIPLIAAIANAVFTPFKSGIVYNSFVNEFYRVRMYFACVAPAKLIFGDRYFSENVLGQAFSALCNQTTLSMLGADEWLLKLLVITQLAMPTLLHFSNVDADKSIQSYLQFLAFVGTALGFQIVASSTIISPLFNISLNKSETFSSVFSWTAVCSTAAQVYGAAYSLVNYFFKPQISHKNDSAERRIRELEDELTRNGFSM